MDLDILKTRKISLHPASDFELFEELIRSSEMAMSKRDASDQRRRTYPVLPKPEDSSAFLANDNNYLVPKRIDSYPLDDLLTNLYKPCVVDFDENLMRENKQIVNELIENIIDFLKEDSGLKYISYEEQGSSYENAKVFQPNECDLLLLLAAENESIPMSDKIKKDLRRIRKDNNIQEDMTLCYNTIQMPKFMSKNQGYKQFQDVWPGTKEKCVSSHNMRHWCADGLYKYWKKMENVNDYEIKGVKRIDQPFHHPPALTIVIWKTDGTSISVDITVCIRLYGPAENLYFIAKKTPKVDPYLDHRDCMLWLPTNSIKEKLKMLQKLPKQLENYRIVKALLYKKKLLIDNNAYIIKSIFLRDATDKLPSAHPTVCLNYFLEALQKSYGAEVRSRENGCFSENDKKYIVEGYLNPRENVLAKYEYEVIKRSLADVDGILKLRDSNNKKGYILELIRDDLEKFQPSILNQYLQ